MSEEIKPPEGSEWCAWCGEHPAAPGEPCDACRKLGAESAVLPFTDQNRALLDLDTEAVAVKEKETAILTRKLDLARRAESAGPGAVAQIASTMGCSAQAVYVWARMAHEIPLDMVDPTIPLSLYRAAMEAAAQTGAAASEWLARAIASEWSARQLRDAADVRQGRRIASIAWIDGEVSVTPNDDGETFTIDPVNFRPSGVVPHIARARIVPVLTAECTAGH